jgi:cell division protein FtsB
MDPRSSTPPEPDAALAAVDVLEPADGGPAALDGTATRPPDLDTLPVAGITKRRVAFVIAAVFTAWIVVVFARQVGEAATATGRADDAVAQNAALTADVAAMQRELQLVQRKAYIQQQARGYGLGKETEIPFSLAQDAPALPADAAGSAAQALGASQDRSSPLDTWLRLLFGPGDGG